MHSQKFREKSGEKRYSYQDMKNWCQRMIDIKTQQLLSQINQNNSIIKILSEKLTKAQIELQKRDQMLQSACQRLFTSTKAPNIELINKLLNDKLRDRFQIVNNSLSQLKNMKSIQNRTILNVSQYQNAMEQMMTNQIHNLKQQIRQKMGQVKSSNQKYWSKIKGWAKMFEEKQKKCEQGILALHKDIKKLQHNTADGVMEIFKLKNLKSRLKQMEQAVYDIEESFKLIGQRQIQLKQSMENKQYRPQIIQLSYSKDQSQIYYVPQIKQSHRSDTDYYQTTSDQQQYLKVMSKSPLRGSENGSIASSNILRGFNKKFNNLEDFSMLSSVKSDDGRTSFSSRLKSLQNVSIHVSQARKVMVSQIKSRLKQLIVSKGLQTPILSHLDELHYLKNQQNNYMFDIDGNMFKLTEQQYKQLCFDKILMPA